MRSLCGVQPLRGEDAVAASVRKMSNQEADDCAALIVEIFGLMCQADVNAARPSYAWCNCIRWIARPTNSKLRR